MVPPSPGKSILVKSGAGMLSRRRFLQFLGFAPAAVVSASARAPVVLPGYGEAAAARELPLTVPPQYLGPDGIIMIESREGSHLWSYDRVLCRRAALRIRVVDNGVQLYDADSDVIFWSMPRRFCGHFISVWFVENGQLFIERRELS